LEQLFRRPLDRALDAAQRLHFYLIILFTRGSGTHQLDFRPQA
jgi:hypothetical protein